MCEKAEGQRVRGSKEERRGAYSVRENRLTAADEEICRPSVFAAEPMVVGGYPCKSRMSLGTIGSRYREIGGGFFVWYY